MKIITLWQPWASLIAYDLKRYETRSWPTNYRGPLLIHAAKRPFVSADGLKTLCPSGWAAWQDAMRNCAHLQAQAMPYSYELPLGAVVAIAELKDCGRMMPTRGYAAPWEVRVCDQTPLERAVGDWQPGRFAWELANVQRLPEPIPWRGGQGLRDAPPELQALVAAAPKVDCLVPF